MLTVHETARQLNISRNACYRLIHSGKLGAVRTAGPNRYLVPPEAIEQYLAPQPMLPARTFNPTAEFPALLTVAEVCQVLRCTGQTVRRLVHEGTLRGMRNPGRNTHLRIFKDDVHAYLDSVNRTTSAA